MAYSTHDRGVGVVVNARVMRVTVRLTTVALFGRVTVTHSIRLASAYLPLIGKKAAGFFALSIADVWWMEQYEAVFPWRVGR
jgi:hypothetical protein